MSLGLIIGLDYKNTYLNTFQELQRFKDYPLTDHKSKVEKSRIWCTRLEGGWQALPQCTFREVIGCAVTLDNAQLKGSYSQRTALKLPKRIHSNSLAISSIRL